MATELRPMMNLNLTLIRQRGIALPVMLLMLLTMLATSIFLIKSINSTTLLTGNLAYESARGKQADLGLVTGFNWLSATARVNKGLFNNAQPAQGYVANFNMNLDPSLPRFWDGSVFLNDAATNTRVQYVIHRLCNFTGPYDQITPFANRCVLTTDPATGVTTAAIGSSLVGNSVTFASAPQVHDVITSRISGPRGGNVVNQLVVLIGA
jgi:hypothetical protein